MNNLCVQNLPEVVKTIDVFAFGAKTGKRTTFVSGEFVAWFMIEFTR